MYLAHCILGLTGISILLTQDVKLFLIKLNISDYTLIIAVSLLFVNIVPMYLAWSYSLTGKLQIIIGLITLIIVGFTTYFIYSLMHWVMATDEDILMYKNLAISKTVSYEVKLKSCGFLKKPSTRL